jgi:hypothetical protein
MRDARRLTICEPFRSIFYAPQWVALHGGDFAAEGLDVEVRTAGGGLTTTGALMDGHSEIALGGIRRSLDVADRAGPFLVHSAEVNQRNGFFLPRSGGPAPQQGARAASGGLCDRSRGAGGRRAASEKRLYVASSRVAESGVIGVPHEIKGEAVVCFVVLRRVTSRRGRSARSSASAWLERWTRRSSPRRCSLRGICRDAERQDHAPRDPRDLSR